MITIGRKLSERSNLLNTSTHSIYNYSCSLYPRSPHNLIVIHGLKSSEQLNHALYPHVRHCDLCVTSTR